jgi:V/A-type H+-transporting ATPase subunit D
MAQLKLSKASLQEQRTKLKLYQKLLPSLELKRRQLTVELDKARKQYEAIRAEVEQLEARVGAELTMLANTEIDLKGLVTLTSLQLGQENVVGVRLPLLEEVQWQVADYSPLAKPAWVDALVDRLRDAAEGRLRVQVAAERVRILARAERRVTQRVNLFEKILIPRTLQNIGRIQIWLGDMGRAAVVQAKLAKARQVGDQDWTEQEEARWP